MNRTGSVYGSYIDYDYQSRRVPSGVSRRARKRAPCAALTLHGGFSLQCVCGISVPGAASELPARAIW